MRMHAGLREREESVPAASASCSVRLCLWGTRVRPRREPCLRPAKRRAWLYGVRLAATVSVLMQWR